MPVLSRLGLVEWSSLNYNLNVMETNQETTNVQPEPRKAKVYASFGRQFAFSLFVGLVLGLLTLGVIVFRFEAKYTDKVYPNVKVNNIDLSGLSLGQAVSRLNADLNYPSQGKVVFSYDGRQWVFSPKDLGYTNNPTAVAQQAFQAGREGSWLENFRTQFSALRTGINIQTSAAYDQALAYAKLQEIANQVDKAVVEASISIEGTEIKSRDGQTGYTLDIPATMDKLQAYFLIQKDAEIPLVIHEQAPVLADASETAKQAEAMLSAPLTMHHPNPDLGLEPWVIQPQDLANLITIERQTEGQEAGFKLSLNKASLEHYLSSIAPKFVVQPENARMRFNEETRELELTRNAKIGKTLDIDGSVALILESLQNNQHEVNLILKDLAPQVTDTTTAAELGITELVAEETSYFYGSEAARVQNIQAGSTTFNGILIAPGEVFSMAKYMTDISLDNGYAEAIIIVGDQSVKGIGGGICQVSTTLFRTAFFGGFPIVERHAHAYRVSYYEQQSNGWANANLAGLDASIFVPFVDLKFKNDSEHWILMDTEMTNNSLTWKFYSTKDGRRVEWNSTGITNVIEPPEDIWREDPTLAEGQIKQVDWAVNGASVSVNRSVYKGDTLWFNDAIHTTYVAWPNGYNYGPGTEIP